MPKKPTRGLFIEDSGDGIQLVVLFDQGFSQGELCIPLTLTRAGKLRDLLTECITRKGNSHSKRLPVKSLTCHSGGSTNDHPTSVV